MRWQSIKEKKKTIEYPMTEALPFFHSCLTHWSMPKKTGTSSQDGSQNNCRLYSTNCWGNGVNPHYLYNLRLTCSGASQNYQT